MFILHCIKYNNNRKLLNIAWAIITFTSISIELEAELRI